MDPPVKRLCHNRLCHREEAESRRGDLVISSAYTGLLRRFASRNDEKSHCDTASKPEDDTESGKRPPVPNSTTVPASLARVAV